MSVSKLSIKKMEPEYRFVARIRLGANGCWLWVGTLNAYGYGQLRVPVGEGTKRVMAHRFGYEMWVGKIPDGLDLDHLCRVRHCVNPEHLEPVTRKVNLNRGVGAEAARHMQLAKTECRNGHPYTNGSFRRDYRGYRECLICRTATSRRYLRKKGMSDRG